MNFTCTARPSGQRLVVTVAGDIDLAIYPRFQAEAEAWAGKDTDIILECSEVSFIDSMGLRVLVEFRRLVTEAGHTFTLAGPSRPVTRVLELAGVHSLFDVSDLPQPAGETTA
jgi:anti-anti-sigma factor